MRLLYLTPFPPHADAPHGGARAMAQWIGAMADRHEVTLLHFQAEDEAPVSDDLRERCAHVEAIRRYGDHGPLRWRLWRAARLGAAPVFGTPQWAASVHRGQFEARVRAWVETWSPDVVQAELHVMGPYLRPAAAAGIPTVLVEHEPGVEMAEERLRRASPIARPWHQLNVAAWRRFEPAVLSAARAVVVFTERDRQAVHALAPRADVVEIPIALPISEAAGPEGEAPSLLFVGNFEHPPNRDAAEHLTGSILPRVRAACPDARLVIVGPSTRTYVQPSEGVVVEGHVPDVQPYLDAASVVVAPLYTGGGMRIKVVEAIAAGKAVVATPRAVRGIEIEDGTHVYLAGDDETFADRIVDLLRAPEERAALGARARAWAQAHLGVGGMADAYDALYRRLTDR